MQTILNNLSIITPVAPDEKAWENLWIDLKDLSTGTEIIFSGPTKPVRLPDRIQWVDSELGRAKQLNEGTRKASGHFLWFLHADSRLTPKTLPALLTSLDRDPSALHYFNLRFLPDGPPLMFINEIGCWIRSHILDVPFGDQGFVVSKEIFETLGGFPENVPYGEDHVFVWRARQERIPLRCTGTWLFTSARRYKETGWARLTWTYARLWTKQAWPEWRKTL